MDLINALVGELGVEQGQAEALAGAVVGGVQAQLEDNGDADGAAEVTQAVPELSGWADKAQSLLGGGGGGLLGAASGLLGGGGGGGLLGALSGLGDQPGFNLASVVGLLGKLDLDLGKAGSVAALIGQFLKGRLSEGLMGKVAAFAPFLLGGGDDKGDGGGSGGGLGGMLGGLLGS